MDRGGSPSWGGSPSRGDSPSGGGGGSPSPGSLSRGVLHPGGLLHRGGLHPGGFSIPGGVLHPGRGGSPPGGVSILGGVPCDISHHAFDVTCLLPPHQLRHINSAPAYILLPGHLTCKACWDTHPPPLWTDTHL